MVYSDSWHTTGGSLAYPRWQPSHKLGTSDPIDTKLPHLNAVTSVCCSPGLGDGGGSAFPRRRLPAGAALPLLQEADPRPVLQPEERARRALRGPDEGTAAGQHGAGRGASEIHGPGL